MKSIRWYPFFLALLVGCVVNYIGDLLIGVRVELFYGLATFGFLWFLQIFVWPFVVGLSVSFIYGLGGKWLSMFPPLIMRTWAYYETQYFIGVPAGSDLMPMGWWAFFVILAMEVAMIGGVFGEIAIKRVYGRSAPMDNQTGNIDGDAVIGQDDETRSGS